VSVDLSWRMLLQSSGHISYITSEIVWYLSYFVCVLTVATVCLSVLFGVIRMLYIHNCSLLSLSFVLILLQTSLIAVAEVIVWWHQGADLQISEEGTDTIADW